jgi:hypothetical protein
MTPAVTLAIALAKRNKRNKQRNKNLATGTKRIRRR